MAILRHFFNPIRELAECMKHTTSNTLSHKVDTVGYHDEITDLINSFNSMTGQLEESFSMQKRFSAHAAHELRTPLAVIQTKLEVFFMKERSEPEYKALLDVINTQVLRLSSLVKSLLELTEVNQMSLQDTISLPQLLADVASDMEPVAQKRHITITLHSIDTNSLIMGNYTLLYRVFYNLVENAIRYNQVNGQVDLSIQEYSDQLNVQIADTGVGIPNECKPHLFEPFYRVDRSRSRELGGAGIGLSLVHTILDYHGASISVSDRKNGGCIFEVSFIKR